MIQLINRYKVVSISQWKDIVKPYKFEMKPTKNQKVKLNQILSIYRHLYYLPTLRNRNDETGKYFQEVYAQVLQNVIKRVDITCQNFFRIQDY